MLSISRISGNAASDKNIKDGVCAQIEKNFARAKWKVMLHLRLLAQWPTCSAESLKSSQGLGRHILDSNPERLEIFVTSEVCLCCILLSKGKAIAYSPQKNCRRTLVR